MQNATAAMSPPGDDLVRSKMTSDSLFSSNVWVPAKFKMLFAVESELQARLRYHSLLAKDVRPTDIILRLG